MTGAFSCVGTPKRISTQCRSAVYTCGLGAYTTAQSSVLNWKVVPEAGGGMKRSGFWSGHLDAGLKILVLADADFPAVVFRAWHD